MVGGWGAGKRRMDAGAGASGRGRRRGGGWGGGDGRFPRPGERRHPRRAYFPDVRTAFLFFQAEDGIRDLTVTGVQTCALPILARAQRPAKMLRVGTVAGTPKSSPQWVAFERRMGELGYQEGKNFSFDFLQAATEIGRASCRERV